MIRLATEDFVPVAGDDWYQRRRADTEGEFFRRVSDQTGGRGRDDGGTRQSIYCLTASGRLLVARNHQGPDEVREQLEEALRAFSRLPDDERRPGAVHVPDLVKVDPRYARTPPRGGLVLNVWTRILDHDRGGKLCRGSCRFPGGESAARDHAWLTRADVQALMPDKPRVGDQVPMPGAVTQRLLRYHFVDNTRGEPPFWDKGEIHKARLAWTVEAVDDEVTRLRLEGEVLLANAKDAGRADRGFDAKVIGHLRYDRKKKEIYRLQIAAVGEHWGRGPFTGGDRPGRMPLGVVLELAKGDGPWDRVPPQAARDYDDYLGKQP